MFKTLIDARMRAPSEARELDNLPPFTDDQLAEFDRLFGLAANGNIYAPPDPYAPGAHPAPALPPAAGGPDLQPAPDVPPAVEPGGEEPAGSGQAALYLPLPRPRRRAGPEGAAMTTPCADPARAGHGAPRREQRASVDNSAWDGGAAMSGCANSD